MKSFDVEEMVLLQLRHLLQVLMVAQNLEGVVRVVEEGEKRSSSFSSNVDCINFILFCLNLMFNIFDVGFVSKRC